MYQWAATLTQNGANLPFALPLKADKVPSGFQVGGGCLRHQCQPLSSTKWDLACVHMIGTTAAPTPTHCTHYLGPLCQQAHQGPGTLSCATETCLSGQCIGYLRYSPCFVWFRCSSSSPRST
jgi:hypothetical protein